MAQHCGSSFFGAGLAIAAGNTDKNSVLLSRCANASGGMQRLYHVRHNNLQKIRGNIAGRLSAKRRTRSCFGDIRNKAMPIDTRALDDDIEISPTNLAAIMLCGRKNVCRVRCGCAQHAHITLITLKYILEREHTWMSSASLSLMAFCQLYHTLFSASLDILLSKK